MLGVRVLGLGFGVEGAGCCFVRVLVGTRHGAREVQDAGCCVCVCV